MSRTRHIDIRFGETSEDQLAWEILHRHDGYATISAYLKAVVIAYDKQTRLRPETIKKTDAASELDAMLDIITK